jgi:hypothetical protein
METGTRYIFGSFEMDWYNSFLNISWHNENIYPNSLKITYFPCG